MYSKEIYIKDTNGLHTRFSAMLVNKASNIKSKYNINLYIKKPPYTDWLGISMLALLSLKVQQNENVFIGADINNPNCKIAVKELIDYINSTINNTPSVMNQIDAFIEESKIANEQILESLPIGVLVIDSNSNITNINEYALSLIDKNHEDVLGKKISDIIPTTELPNIIKTKSKHFGHIQHINNKITMVNRTPIFNNEKVIGAIGVLQDVSDIIGIKELNEKFKKILECSHDMICFVDEFGKVSYINPGYENTLKSCSKNIIGKDINIVSPNGLRYKSFKDKITLQNIRHTKDGIDLISTIEPIFIDNIFKGVISTSKPVNEIKEIMKKLRKSEEELNYYKEELLRHTSISSFQDIIGASGVLKDILYICEKASKSTSTVLIRGESGTGKELIAKAIHNNSLRKDKPFVRVNCAAIPENLLESELFGFEKGAFTGAIKSKPGKFTIADGGTIFLDEIGDMPVYMQVKLLRVLQEKEIESLGGLEPHKIDVRVIAATNRDLESLMKSGDFREDLYYRLNVLSINLPTLKERKADIPLLVEHFIAKLNKKLNKNIKSIDSDCMNLLQNYSWPGNIRELENIIERAINLCEGNHITSRDLPTYIIGNYSSSTNLINVINDEILPFEEYEKQIIELAINKYGSFNKAGKALGLTHRTISLKCKKYGINKDS
ncbi:sigma 54-interacting transcriptional regulator [Clostridium fallax]|uniref:HTH-type transcriptional regulatory protein TyrR n=1 Tax=Clostridium fallax TaxID=1533 RepID=A0A1M4TTS2_9CLOT|nr:sigma 54-interacting transcriptional regulator [Clostridium fallax]SHE47881.1 phosphotransferase system HPr (HPr) family [Clostridium fallax]SQB22398.1 sigma-L-dependent transcriptional regulator [Clostridium fallax]